MEMKKEVQFIYLYYEELKNVVCLGCKKDEKLKCNHRISTCLNLGQLNKFKFNIKYTLKEEQLFQFPGIREIIYSMDILQTFKEMYKYWLEFGKLLNIDTPPIYLPPEYPAQFNTFPYVSDSTRSNDWFTITYNTPTL